MAKIALANIIKRQGSMHVNLVKIISSFLFVLLILSCSNDNKVTSEPWSIKNVMKQEERTVFLMNDTPKNLSIHLKGEMSGVSMISIRGNGRSQIMVHEIPAGLIDSTITNPWTSSICKIKYAPKDAVEGNLDISVRLLK